MAPVAIAKEGLFFAFLLKGEEAFLDGGLEAKGTEDGGQIIKPDGSTIKVGRGQKAQVDGFTIRGFKV